MSPLAQLLLQTLSPWVVLPGLLIEWWAVWFTLGRNFTTTSLFVLIANGASLLAATVLVFSGVLGDAALGWRPPAWPPALVAALAALLLDVAVEGLVLRTLMRRLRGGWSWNRYDLLTFAAANVPGLAAACWLAERAAA